MTVTRATRTLSIESVLSLPSEHGASGRMAMKRSNKA